MELQFYHPRMYMCSTKVPTTMGIAVTLTKPVDGDALLEAAEYPT